MKKIPLSGGRAYALVDDSDYEWLKGFDWCIDKNGYAICTIRMARLIARTPRGMVCDHKNGKRSDNRKSNLRNCTRVENQYNRKKFGNAVTSPYKGVYLARRPKRDRYECWYTEIRYQGRQYQRIGGVMPTEHIAALMYDFWATFFHGDFAKTNFKVIATSEKPIGGFKNGQVLGIAKLAPVDGFGRPRSGYKRIPKALWKTRVARKMPDSSEQDKPNMLLGS